MSERPVAIGLFREAVLRFGEGKTTTASRLADRARELFLAAGDVDGACAAALLRGRSALRAARYPEAAEWLSWARDEANRRGLEPRVLAANSELAVLAELQGDLLSAVAAHRGVLERQRVRDDSLGIAMAAGNVARLLTRVAGHQLPIVTESRALLDEALQRFRDGPHEAGIANTLICIGDLDRADGKLDQALKLFQEVVDLPPTPSVQPMRLLALHNLGNVLRQMGDYVRASDAFLGAVAMAETLGDVRSTRRARTSLAMTRAMNGPLRIAVQELTTLRAGLGPAEEAARAILAMNEAQLHLAAGNVKLANGNLLQARRHDTERGDRPMLDEIALVIASLALLSTSDRLVFKEIRRRKVATPSVVRERQLLRAQAAFRRLDLDDFDAAVVALGQAASWQEAVGIGAACVERAALAGLDSIDGLEQMAGLAVQRGARVDYLQIRLAQAHAALWLGDLKRAAAWADEVQGEAATLNRRIMALSARMVNAFAGGQALAANAWRDEAKRLRDLGAVVPAAWSDAAAAVALRDDDALDGAIRTLHQAGDEFHKLFLLAWRAAYGPPELAALAATLLETAGVFVPPWLRAVANPTS